MHLAVAVRDVHVRHTTAQGIDRRRILTGQRQVRDIEIGHHRRVTDLVEEPQHAGDVVQKREREGFQLQRNLQSQSAGTVAHGPDVPHSGGPLLLRGDHFLLPDVFAQHQQ